MVSAQAERHGQIDFIFSAIARLMVLSRKTLRISSRIFHQNSNIKETFCESSLLTLCFSHLLHIRGHSVIGQCQIFCSHFLHVHVYTHTLISVNLNAISLSITFLSFLNLPYDYLQIISNLKYK